MAPRNTTSTRKLAAAATPKKRGRPFGSTNKRTAIASMRRTPTRSAGPKGTTRTATGRTRTAPGPSPQARGAATRNANVVLKAIKAMMLQNEQILGILQKAFPGIVETLPTSQRSAA